MQRYLMLALTALCLQVFAAPALVQNTAPCFSTSAVLSETCSFSTLPTVGDVVVVGYSLGTSTTGVTKVTDNQTNGYVMEDDQPQNGSQASAFWCSVVQVSSGTFTVTVTPNGNQYVSMVLLEYSGVSCNPDTAPVAATNATSPFTCGSITTTVATDVLLTWANNNGGGTVTYTAPTGFTLEEQQSNGSTAQSGAIADQITSSTGTFSPTWTISVNTTTQCVLVALRPQSGGGSGGQTGFPIVQ